MLSPFAQAAQSLQGPPGMMPGMTGAPGMGAPVGGMMPQTNPLAALGAGPVNPNERPLIMSSSAGFMDGIGGSSSMNMAGVIDSVIRDQMKFPPQNESVLRLDPRMMDPMGPMSQQQGGMSLAGQMQQGTASAPSLGQQLQQAPRSTMGGASSPLLQALGGMGNGRQF